MGVITVTLFRASAWIRFPCFCCGGESGKDMINADVFEDGERMGLVVCERCLGDADLAATVRQSAARARADAEKLEKFATNPPALPSRAEWEAANAAENLEYEREYARGVQVRCQHADTF